MEISHNVYVNCVHSISFGCCSVAAVDTAVLLDGTVDTIVISIKN
jgi:hypothetical protein